MKKCPICDGNLQYTKKMTKHSYKGHTKSFEQSGDFCKSCGEGFLSPKDLRSTKEKIINFHRQVDHLLSTDELKRIRKKIGLKQQEASELFGGGIRAFSKYETAKSNQSKPLDILFRLMDNNTLCLDDIRKVAR